MTVLLTRAEMEEKLRQAFAPEQTASLVEVLDNIRQVELERAADTRDLKRGLKELTEEIKKLATAQRHTDERIGELATAQRHTNERIGELAAAQRRTDERLAAFQQRTDERLAELATAQRHTDERVGELAAAQRHTNERIGELAAAQRRTDERLAAFQQRTDERLAELAAAQQRTDEAVAQLSRAVQTLAETVHTGLAELRQAVGSLANRFGFSLEEFVAALLPPYLERHAGITNLTLERRYFEIADGRWEEVDLVGTGRRDGRPVTVLAECRTTIGGGEMRRLATKLADVAATLADREVLKVVVAMNLHPTGEEAARETGIWAIPYSRVNRERG